MRGPRLSAERVHDRRGDWVSYTCHALRLLTAYLLKESIGPWFSILRPTLLRLRRDRCQGLACPAARGHQLAWLVRRWSPRWHWFHHVGCLSANPAFGMLRLLGTTRRFDRAQDRRARRLRGRGAVGPRPSEPVLPRAPTTQEADLHPRLHARVRLGTQPRRVGCTSGAAFPNAAMRVMISAVPWRSSRSAECHEGSPKT